LIFFAADLCVEKHEHAGVACECEQCIGFVEDGRFAACMDRRHGRSRDGEAGKGASAGDVGHGESPFVRRSMLLFMRGTDGIRRKPDR